ncbi:MAG: lipid II flippase family protein [Candidatus Velthaea sp.]
MSDVFVPNLILAVVLNAATQAIQIGAYAARYAGVTTGRIATAISLFSLFVTASRLAALFLVPALGGLSDTVAAETARRHLATVPDALLHVYDTQMRLIVASGTLGVAAGAVLLPTFIVLFVRGIKAFERRGSIPLALLRLLDVRVQADLFRSLRVPSPAMIRRFPLSAVPRKLLIANMVLWAVYAVGVVAAYYASIVNLDARTTATGLSGLVNGIGTVAFSLFVDPTSAYIVDQTARGERDVGDVRAMIFWLIVTALVGTVLAQLILYPAAQYIAFAAHFFVRH